MGVSAYWFATSFKWFILLVAVLPSQVASIVPDDVKNTYWGRLFLIGALWAVIGPAVFGRLSDQRGRRKPFIAAGAALTVVALAVLAQIREVSGNLTPPGVDMGSFMVLVVGYLLLQVSDDLGTGPYSAIVPEVVPEEKRGLASGYLGVAKLLAQFLGGISVFFLGGNWLKLYIVIGVVNLLFAIWTLRTYKEAPDREPQPEQKREPFVQAFLRPWQSADFRWVFASSFLLALAFYLVQPYLRNYMHDVVQTFDFMGRSLGSSILDSPDYKENAATVAAALLALTISIFGAVGAGVTARLGDRDGRKPVIYWSGVLMFVTLIPFALVTNFQIIAFLAIFFGFGYGARLAAEWALVSDVLPAGNEAGKDMGIWQMSNSSVQLIAGGSGALIDQLNRTQMGLGYRTFFVAAAVLFLLSTVLVRFVKGSR